MGGIGDYVSKASGGTVAVGAGGIGAIGIDYVTGGKLSDAANGGLRQLGVSSPFHKPNLNDMPEVVDPTPIDTNLYNAPTDMGINPVGHANIAGGPNSYQQAFRNYQAGLARQLADQVAGRGPSLAAEQARTTMNQGIAQQFAMANSARGGNNAAMARQAMMQGSDMAAQVTQQAAQARLAEQMQAAQQLGQVSSAARGQDINLSVEQAKLNQSSILKNADMQVQKAQLAAQYANMGLDARRANLMADLQVQQLIQNRTAAQNGQILTMDQTNKQMWGGLISGGAKAAATASTGGAAGSGGGSQSAAPP